MPLVPPHQFKAFVDVDLTSRLGLDVNLIAMGGSYARGNENNAHEPDDIYYLGVGSTERYAFVNLGGRYQLTRWLQVIGQINNLFDAEYATASQLGPAAFTADGRFIARPLPATNGEFPVRQTTFLSPGAPIRAWLGARIHF
jgi:outer membrane receptor protein involved in Fe transport